MLLFKPFSVPGTIFGFELSSARLIRDIQMSELALCNYTCIVPFHLDLSVFCSITLILYNRKLSGVCFREASRQHDAATTRLHGGDGVFLMWRGEDRI